MIMLVLMWYFVGVVLAFVLLLIGNTIALESGDCKVQLKYILFSWLFNIITLGYILSRLSKKHLQTDKIKEFFNQEPDLKKK